MTDDDIDGYLAELRRWATAPWWRRWWVRWCLWHREARLRQRVLAVVSELESVRLDLEDCQARRAALYHLIEDLGARFQGLARIVKEIVVPDQQDKFVATMYDAIDRLNERGGFTIAKPKVSTVTTPLVCGSCGKTSNEPGLRFYQGVGNAVTCFACLGVDGGSA